MDELFNKLKAPFRNSQVSWRAQALTQDKKSAMALAYIDARDVMNRLDDVCGPDGWMSEHFDLGQGKTGCKISIYCEDKRQWIWKSDGAGDTAVEGDKGAISDALKRAAVSWGIGRYLYGLGATWVPCEIGANGKFKKFTVDPWTKAKIPWYGPKNRGELRDAIKMFSDDVDKVASREDLKDLMTLHKDTWEQMKLDSRDDCTLSNKVPDNIGKRINKLKVAFEQQDEMENKQ